MELSLLPGFREIQEYYPAERPNVKRQVVLFLAEYTDQVPCIMRPDEIISIKSLRLDEALSISEYDETKRVLLEADNFLRGKL